MFRPATRSIARSTALRAFPRVSAPTRRFISTAPPTEKSRSWKSLAARVGIAGTIIYYYNTYEVFAEEPAYAVQALPVTDEETEVLPTIEDVSKARQQRKTEAEALAAAKQKQSASQSDVASVPAGGVQDLEEEAGQQGAFNPETGEINWDCPCLGGMADGPCGEEFKAAFSCFVFSTEEPKGMDCIEKFKGMQNCFREYPEIYGSEMDADDDDEIPAEGAVAAEAAVPVQSGSVENAKAFSQPASKPVKPLSGGNDDVVPEAYRPAENTKAARSNAATVQVARDHVPVSESEELVPRAAHDATNVVEEKK